MKDTNKIHVDVTVDIIALLEYIGCEDIATVFKKIHYWDFIRSLSSFYARNNHLSYKQTKTLVTSIYKHTGVTCNPKNKYVITHEVQYDREEEDKKITTKKTVEHNFDDLQTIQLFDLPLEDGETNSYLFHPYNDHSLVIKLEDSYFKIPKPTNFETIYKPTTIAFKYHRTEKKGFLTRTIDHTKALSKSIIYEEDASYDDDDIPF